MGSAAFVAYLSGLCNLEFTATQYALLSSLAAVGRTTLSASGGALADALGWIPFFVLSTAACLPGLAPAVVDHARREPTPTASARYRSAVGQQFGRGGDRAKRAAAEFPGARLSTSRQKRGPWFISTRCATSWATT